MVSKVISASKAAKVETASPTTETNGAPPLTLLELDGKVERRHAYAGGPRSEIFVGQWTKGGASAEVEKVGLSLTVSVPLMGVFLGSPESPSNVWFLRGGT